MKDNKNFIFLIFSLLLVGAVLCIFLAAQQWQADKDGHYRFRLFDAKIAYEAHTLAGETCSVCGATVQRGSDGTYIVIQQNRHGDTFRLDRYHADGTVKSSQSRDLVYDPSGNLIYEKEYSNGRLVARIMYETDIYGKRAAKTAHYYAEDGTSEYYEYNDHREPSKKIAYNTWGWPGDVYTYENEYFEFGARVQRTYVNGRLTIHWDTGGATCFGGYMWNKKTVFHEDGSKTLYEYDQHNILIRETHYDAAGNVTKKGI